MITILGYACPVASRVLMLCEGGTVWAPPPPSNPPTAAPTSGRRWPRIARGRAAGEGRTDISDELRRQQRAMTAAACRGGTGPQCRLRPSVAKATAAGTGSPRRLWPVAFLLNPPVDARTRGSLSRSGKLVDAQFHSYRAEVKKSSHFRWVRRSFIARLSAVLGTIPSI